jgi:hypothetical protein
MRSADLPHYFLLATHGQTASMWIAAALNSHPDIFCTHAYHYPPSGAQFAETTDTELKKTHTGGNNRFWGLSVDDYLQELTDAAGGAPYVGNVHAFYLGRLLSMLSSSKHCDRLRIANIIRHPIGRMMSAFSHWQRLVTLDPAIKNYLITDTRTNCGYIMEYLKPLFPSLDLEDTDVMLFLLALRQMDVVSEDAGKAIAGGILQVTFEEVTTKPQAFAELFHGLTGARPTPAYLDALFAREAINAHAKGKRLSPEEMFAGWQSWQQKAFSFIADKSKMRENYAPAGYDFNFMGKW